MTKYDKPRCPLVVSSAFRGHLGAGISSSVSPVVKYTVLVSSNDLSSRCIANNDAQVNPLSAGPGNSPVGQAWFGFSFTRGDYRSMTEKTVVRITL